MLHALAAAPHDLDAERRAARVSAEELQGGGRLPWSRRLWGSFLPDRRGRFSLPAPEVPALVVVPNRARPPRW